MIGFRPFEAWIVKCSDLGFEVRGSKVDLNDGEESCAKSTPDICLYGQCPH